MKTIRPLVILSEAKDLGRKETIEILRFAQDDAVASFDYSNTRQWRGLDQTMPAVPVEDATTRRTVLVVEDETTMATVLRYNLEREGYRCLVAADGPRALELARGERPDLLLLDVMLPGIDGIEVCRRVRAQSSVPIIMLTARVEEVDRVVGLEVGADDYVTKPFSMRELLARVRASLRRADMRPPQESTLIPLMPGLIIDPNRRQVFRNDRPVPMKPKEFDLLLYLARHPRQVFTREQLLDHVWGYEFGGQTRTVDVHVRWLREKIEPDPANPSYLLTNRGVGYRLETGRLSGPTTSDDLTPRLHR